MITHPGWLAFTFWSLVAACVGLYLLGHMRSLSDFDLMDLLRLALPAVAFVGWTMVEKPPMAFDAACLMTPFSLCAPLLSGKYYVAGILGITVGVLASTLGAWTAAAKTPTREGS